jgi:hypothetical protein
MRTKLLALAVPVVAVALLALNAYRAPAEKEEQKEKAKEKKMLVHNVFFTLKERTPENRQKLVEACKKHLTKHDGEVFFSCGPLCEDLKREVNDTAFDVALTIVFEDKAAHDKYQDHKRHLQFIKENKDLWTKVRVFDNYATK